MAAHPLHRILIHVVAHDARHNPELMFASIPETLFNRSDVHFLVTYEASSDDGPFLLKAWLLELNIWNVTLIQNRINQGYGGIQKIGFRVAIDGGYDCVVMLHCDRHHSLEVLTDVLDGWLEHQPDVVLGSHMQSERGGIRNVINRVFTKFQNVMTGWRLSEYRTSCRAYSTSFLANVPFETNTNDFHFDTEILLQAAHMRASVREIPISHDYGDEVCRIAGLKHALSVVASILQFKMHQLGMLCSLKLRSLSIDRYRDKTAANYSSHSLALQILNRRKARRILDIGCGPGHVAAQCEQMGMRVTGVDSSIPIPDSMSEFLTVDLERDSLPVKMSDFDAVIMLDVIEHLENPEEFLLALRNEDSHDKTELPVLILSTPNVAFAAIRLNLLMGRFNYAERGILDITHKRLFTRKSLLRMMTDCGFEVEQVHAVGVPFEAVMPGSMGCALGTVANLLARIWPCMFAFQFLLECRPKPGVRQVLCNAFWIHEADAAHDSGINLQAMSLHDRPRR